MTTTASTLSPAMRLALRAVVAKPGRLANAYPGGAKTMNGLLRRDLVRSEPVTVAGVTSHAIYPTHYGIRVALVPAR